MKCSHTLHTTQVGSAFGHDILDQYGHCTLPFLKGETLTYQVGSSPEAWCQQSTFSEYLLPTPIHPAIARYQLGESPRREETKDDPVGFLKHSTHFFQKIYFFQYTRILEGDQTSQS